MILSQITNYTIVIGVPFLIVLNIIVIYKTKKQSKSSNAFFDILYLVIGIITFVFSCSVCLVVGYKMSNIITFSLSINPNVEDGNLIKALINQQSITLAVATLSVTLVGVINGAISYFRDKKIQDDEKTIDRIRNNIEDMEKTVRTISSICSIQMLEAKDAECYYDLISQYLQEETGSYHSKLALLSLKSTIIRENHAVYDKEYDCYSDIIEIAKKMLEENIATSDKEFALLELINALYKRARLNLYKEDSSVDLQEAEKRIKQLELLNPRDTYGNISNLKGLVHFWKSKTIQNHSIIKRELTMAQKEFQTAIKSNPQKIQFLNHLGVTQINIYEQLNKSEYYTMAEDTYEKILKLDPTYSKAFTNLGHLYLSKVEKELNFTSYSTKLSTHLKNKYNASTIIICKELIVKAKKMFDKSIQYSPRFIDNYYKRVQANIYMCFIIINQKIDCDLKEYIDEIQGDLVQAKNLIKKSYKVLIQERNFYDVFKNDDNANMINDQLIEMNIKSAKIWAQQGGSNKNRKINPIKKLWHFVKKL